MQSKTSGVSGFSLIDSVGSPNVEPQVKIVAEPQVKIVSPPNEEIVFKSK